MTDRFSLKSALFLLIIGVFLISSCNNTSKTEQASEGESAEKPKNTLPVPQRAFFEKLNTVDYIDYLFDDLSFSVSVSNINSVRGNLGYLTGQEVANISCTKALGTVYYQSNGEHVAQARSYFGNGCGYFIFTDKSNRPLMAVQMSEAGKTFFNQIVNQTKTTPAPPTAPAEGNSEGN